MKHEEMYTNETLNAFIDGQLSQDASLRLLQDMEYDTGLRERVRELYEVRDLLRFALREDNATGESQRLPSKARFGLRHALAAGVLLLLGVTVGWFSHQHNTDTAQLLAMNPMQQQVANSDTLQLLLHIDSADDSVIQTALDQAESLLQTYHDGNKKLNLEIIANAQGLAMMRADTSTVSQRIQALQQQYDNVTFLACRKSIERLRLERGIQAQLLPGVEIVPSALDRILLRLRHGWTYIKT